MVGEGKGPHTWSGQTKSHVRRGGAGEKTRGLRRADGKSWELSLLHIRPKGDTGLQRRHGRSSTIHKRERLSQRDRVTEKERHQAQECLTTKRSVENERE